MNRLAMSLVVAFTLICSVIVVILGTTFTETGVTFAQAGPEFKLGFKALADQIPDIVGQPLENEHWGANGDSLQMTSNGLMAWRKFDNWTAFTNGSITWINGPAGVQSRANTGRFPWEQEPPPTQAPSATHVPPATASPMRPTPTTIVPNVPTPTPRPTIVLGTLPLEIISATSPVRYSVVADEWVTFTLVARTAPGAECTMTFLYKRVPSDSWAYGGLPMGMTADSSGNASVFLRSVWWPGSWRVQVQAVKDGALAVREATFESVR